MQKLVEIVLPILLCANKRGSKFFVLMCIQLKCKHAEISRYCALNIIMSSRLNITLRNIQSTMVIVCCSSLCYLNEPIATNEASPSFLYSDMKQVSLICQDRH
jgi:hypothetical protein